MNFSWGKTAGLGGATRVEGLGHYVWDTVADRCLQCSEEHAAIHGMSVQDYIAQSSTQNGMTHPDDLELVRGAFHDLRGGKTFQIEYRVVLPDGTIRNIREIGHPIFDEEGRVVQELGTSQDITTETKLRSQLRASEARYRAFFEQSPIPFMEEDWSHALARLRRLEIADEASLRSYLKAHPDLVAELYDACRIVNVSQNFARLYRANSVEELRPFLSHASADANEVAGFADAIVSIFCGAQQTSYNARETTLSGEEISTRITFSLPPEHRATWSSVLIATEDRTSERSLEHALGQARRFEAIGQISGRIAHDFNNLLTIIRAGAEFALQSGEHSEEILGEILSASDRGAALTNQMLSYAGTRPSTPEEIDAGEAVLKMQLLLRSALGDSIQFSVGVSDEVLRVFVDPGLLSDAMMNLLINARDAMPDGGDLSVTVREAVPDEPALAELGRASEAGYAVIMVSDTGCGMAPEVLAKSTEPYFTTKPTGGGLGLSSVYGFAKQSGGTLRVASTPGVGTTASIILPRVAPDAAPAAPGNATDAPS